MARIEAGTAAPQALLKGGSGVRQSRRVRERRHSYEAHTVSDLLQKTEKLIEEAKALLEKVQAGIDETDALKRAVGVDDVETHLQRMVQQALPADVAKAEQLARERIEAIEHERRHAPPPAPLSDASGQAPRRRKFRPMV
ncbi:MAG: hypothetical protein V4609_01920 [Pseudomonadota bacterium]